MNNAERAELGLAATAPVDPSGTEGQHENLVDTLANLRHYAHVNGLDFGLALIMSDNHFVAEMEEERETIRAHNDGEHDPPFEGDNSNCPLCNN